MRKNTTGIHLPTSVLNLIKTHLNSRDYQISPSAIFVSDIALKTLIERSENDFQGRRLKELILEKADVTTRDGLQDIHLNSYDPNQDLIFEPKGRYLIYCRNK